MIPIDIVLQKVLDEHLEHKSLKNLICSNRHPVPKSLTGISSLLYKRSIGNTTAFSPSMPWPAMKTKIVSLGPGFKTLPEKGPSGGRPWRTRRKFEGETQIPTQSVGHPAYT